MLLHTYGVLKGETNEHTHITDHHQDWPDKICEDDSDSTDGCRKSLDSTLNVTLSVSHICNGNNKEQRVSKCSLACLGSVQTFKLFTRTFPEHLL